MFGVAVGLHALTGWDIAAIILVSGFAVTLYTLRGGIEAVIWTDAAPDWAHHDPALPHHPAQMPPVT